MLESFDPLGLARFFVGSEFILLYCAGVVMAALALGVALWRQTKPIIQEVVDARAFLDRTPGERGFLRHFERFHQYLSPLPKLSHTWSEFRKSLILPEGNEPGEAAVLQTRPASEYFNQETLLSSNINLRFYNWVPNLLTGLGIMGTFIGLIAGVFIAGRGLEAGTEEEMIAALNSLLRGASLAFSTSFFGLLSSIGFATYERNVFNRLQRRVIAFTDALDERLRLMTPESLAARQLRELEQQSSQLKSFNTDLAAAVAEALDEKVGQRLGPAIDKLSSTVAALPALLGESVSDMTSGELAKVAAALKDSRELLEGSISRLVALPSQLDESIRGLNKALREDLSSITTQIGSALTGAVTSVKGEFDASGKGFSKVFAAAAKEFTETTQRKREQLEEASQTLGQINAESRELLSQFTQAARELGNLQDAIRATATSLERTSNATGGAIQQVGSSVDAIREVSERLEGGIQHIEESLAASKESWVDYQRRFEGLDTALKNTFEELDTGLTAYTARVGEFMRELDSNVAKVSQSLAAAIEPLNDAMGDLPDEVSRLRETVERLRA